MYTSYTVTYYNIQFKVIAQKGIENVLTGYTYISVVETSNVSVVMFMKYG